LVREVFKDLMTRQQLFVDKAGMVSLMHLAHESIAPIRAHDDGFYRLTVQAT
jgi:hypothetical protein